MDLSQPPSPIALDDEEDDVVDDEYVPVTARKREKVLGKSSYILIAVLVAVGGFIGGAKWKEHHTSSASGTGANTAANGLPAFGAGGFPNRTGANATGTPTGATANGNFGGATIGTIKLVDGTNVYVEDAQGNVVKVTTGADTTVQVSKTGAVSDLKAGDNVIVQGNTGADGNIAATAITSGNTLGFGNRNSQTTTTTAPAG